MSWQDSFHKYFEVSLIGAMRGLCGLPFEHPLDVLKTKIQAFPESSTRLSVVARDLLEREGMFGFYSGALPNGVRMVTKQMYRWPMMLGFPIAYRQLLPKKWQERCPWLVKGVTGVSIAIVETYCITPLERLKVHAMTTTAKDHKVKEFFVKHRAHCFQEAYRGLSVVLCKQVVSWVSFLVADDRCKDWMRKKTNTSELSLFSLLLVSVVVGGINTLATLPLDVVKTQYQRAEDSPSGGMWHTLRTIGRSQGVRGLYRGWQVRMIQYTVQSALTVTVLGKIERSFEPSCRL